MRIRRTLAPPLVIAALGGCLWAGAAPGFPAGALTEDPLERGSAIALPSVYRVEARFEVEGLRLGNGTVIPLPPGPTRAVGEVGTAFAVSPDGVLATAAHVAAPDGPTLARAVAPVALARRQGTLGLDPTYVREWVELNRVRPIRPRLVALRVSQAMPHPDSPRVEATASVIPGSRSAPDDLVLLRIPRGGIPALTLDDALTAGTPVTTIGFGSRDPLSRGADGPAVPEVRRGLLGRTGTVQAVPGQRFTSVTTAVEDGDSGGPAVDASGAVHGVVRWRSADAGGILVQASRLRILLARAGVRNVPGPSGEAFRDGLGRMWRADFAGAETSLRRSLAVYPDHALAGVELDRVATLRASGTDVQADGWRRALLLALGTGFALAAAACLAAALGGAHRPGPPGGAPRSGAAARRTRR